MPTWISRLAHALPGPAIAQDHLVAWLSRRLPPDADPARLRRFADRSGVRVRHAAIDLLGADGDTLYPVGAPSADALERSRAYIRLAPPLAAAAARRACER